MPNPTATRTMLADEILGELIDALEWLDKHGDGLMADVRSGHLNRIGASEWMGEDDREFRRELGTAIAAARAALNKARGQ